MSKDLCLILRFLQYLLCNLPPVPWSVDLESSELSLRLLLTTTTRPVKPAKQNKLEVTREVKLQNLVDSKLRDIENSPLKISVGKKEIVVRNRSGR
jgi:hypothetical protein